MGLGEGQKTFCGDLKPGKVAEDKVPKSVGRIKEWGTLKVSGKGARVNKCQRKRG